MAPMNGSLEIRGGIMQYNEKVVVNGKIYPRDEGLELSKELGCEAIDEPIYEVCKILTDKGYELIIVVAVILIVRDTRVR